MTDSKNEAQMFKANDTAHVTRGKHRGTAATVLAEAGPDGKYPVRYADGTAGVENAVNLKAPAEGTLGEGRLAQELQTAVNDAVAGFGDVSPLQALVSRLEADLPGLGARISWPAAASPDREPSAQNEG